MTIYTTHHCPECDRLRAAWYALCQPGTWDAEREIAIVPEMSLEAIEAKARLVEHIAREKQKY